jgi:hypothetical protein
MIIFAMLAEREGASESKFSAENYALRQKRLSRAGFVIQIQFSYLSNIFATV